MFRAWGSNCIPHYLWDVIIYPFLDTFINISGQHFLELNIFNIQFLNFNWDSLGQNTQFGSQCIETLPWHFWPSHLVWLELLRSIKMVLIFIPSAQQYCWGGGGGGGGGGILVSVHPSVWPSGPPSVCPACHVCPVTPAVLDGFFPYWVQLITSIRGCVAHNDLWPWLIS